LGQTNLIVAFENKLKGTTCDLQSLIFANLALQIQLAAKYF
jgi:hypothetical protein